MQTSGQTFICGFLSLLTSQSRGVKFFLAVAAVFTLIYCLLLGVIQINTTLQLYNFNPNYHSHSHNGTLSTAAATISTTATSIASTSTAAAATSMQTTVTSRNKTQRLVDSTFKFERLNVSVKGKYLLLFSAWFDTRLPNETRIVAVTNQLDAVIKETFTCHFYERVNSTGSADNVTTNHSHSLNRSDIVSDFGWTPRFTTQAVHVRAILPYHAGSMQVLCPARGDLGSGRWYVSIGWQNQSQSGRIPIERIVLQPDRKLFAICVQPFHQKTDEVYKLIEMIELNRLLGADAFYFYDYDTGPRMLKVLQYYTNYTDFVEVIPWKFDAGKMGVFIVGQVAALSDCQHRIRSKYKYLVSVDIDEFIIPRAHKTWLPFDAMFSAMNASQLMFANYFYSPNPNDSTISKDSDNQNLKALKPNLNSLTYTKRWDRHLPFPDRIKSIVRSDCVEDYYIHLAVRFLPIPECQSLQSVSVADTMRVGHLQHYRSHLPWGYVNYNFTLMADPFLPNVYEPELLNAVEKRLNHMQQLGIKIQ